MQKKFTTKQGRRTRNLSKREGTVSRTWGKWLYGDVVPRRQSRRGGAECLKIGNPRCRNLSEGGGEAGWVWGGVGIHVLINEGRRDGDKKGGDSRPQWGASAQQAISIQKLIETVERPDAA